MRYDTLEKDKAELLKKSMRIGKTIKKLREELILLYLFIRGSMTSLKLRCIASWRGCGIERMRREHNNG